MVKPRHALYKPRKKLLSLGLTVEQADYVLHQYDRKDREFGKVIADLTAERDACVNLENICNGQLETVMGERDALTERVRVREAFVAAWDAFEANPTILNRVRLEQARAAIDAQDMPSEGQN